MTDFGYTMMCEQSRPDQLVRDVRQAEYAGFDFSVISDHYAPWLESQGHSGYAWSILGAAAQATERIGLMTYVTCPILRYHPVVVAQKAATMQILSGGRFRLGLGVEMLAAEVDVAAVNSALITSIASLSISWRTPTAGERLPTTCSLRFSPAPSPRRKRPPERICMVAAF